MSDWSAPTRAAELEAQAAEHLARIFGDAPPRNEAGELISPSPVGPEGDAPRETCPLCGRGVPAFELVDARLLDVVPGDYACGACRGQLRRDGVVSRADWAEAHGAPPDVVARLQGEGAGQ